MPRALRGIPAGRDFGRTAAQLALPGALRFRLKLGNCIEIVVDLGLFQIVVPVQRFVVLVQFYWPDWFFVPGSLTHFTAERPLVPKRVVAG